MNQQDRDRKDREAKLRARAGAASRPGAMSVSASPGAYSSTASTNNNNPIATLDQRIHEKMQTGSRPGAVAASSTTADRAYQSKMAGASTSTSTAAAASLHSLEDRIQAKVRQHDQNTAASSRSNNNITTTAATTSSSHTTTANPLQSLEDRIQSKIRQHDGPTAAASSLKAPPPSDSTPDALSRLDERIAAKTAQFRPSNTTSTTKMMMDQKMPPPSDHHHPDLDSVKKDPLELAGSAATIAGTNTSNDMMEKKQTLKAGGRPGGLHDVGHHTDYESQMMMTGLEYTTGDNSEGLAVAELVPEEGEDAFIPVGVEYDPDAKPARYRQTQKFKLYAVGALFVLLLVTVGTTIGIVLARSGGVTESRPGAYDLQVYVQHHVPLADVLRHNPVNGTTSKTGWNDPTNPYTRALRWLQNADPRQMVVGDPALMQRYALAYLYFATTTKRPWPACNPPATPDQTDRCSPMLIDRVYLPRIERFEAPGMGRWLSNLTTCEWLGIICDEFEQVRRIDLIGMNITGAFPPGIKYLPFLQHISFDYNALTGTLPPEMKDLRHVTHLDLENNALTGSIPEEFYEMRSLKSCQIGVNRLSGTISSNIQKLSTLRWIYFYENRLRGTLPSELGSMSRLGNIYIQRNLLTGSIPTELAQLSRMGNLFVFENDLSGSLPSEFVNLPNIGDIRMQSNPRLGGTIPAGLFVHEESMFRFDAFNCNMTGSIPSEIGLVPRLQWLRLHNNHLTGTIPNGLDSLFRLREFTVYGNDLTPGSTVPDDLCTLRTTAELRVLSADCLAPESRVAGVEEVAQNPCPDRCCTMCCRADGQVCEDLVV